MALTRYGVCYDLSESPYVADWGCMEFHFSTKGHMERFMDEVGTRCRWLNDSLSKRFHVPVRTDGLGAVQLYQMIENRGFYVVFDGEVVTCPDALAFRGQMTREDGSRRRFEPSTEPLLG